jgi:rhamnose utilization protein RhaD (predicted bifunctional aldolase and dehydrogenase)/NAD(P)-dependent dehydrogenase (short-subunit alcohol dehydrogenase family)
MRSLWSDTDAARCTTPLEFRVYSSRLLGQEPALVLHGGGNTSVKAAVTDLFGDEVPLLHIKGSGWDLATIEAAGFAPVRLDVLQRMADLPVLSDTDMVRAQRAAMLDPGAPTPSVEAILHAIIPFTYVDHTHADAVVAVSNSPNGEAAIRAIYGDRVFVVPYVMPGFVLARAVREMTEVTDWSGVGGIVLMNHGVFSFGDDAKSSYERMIALVTRAEEYLASKGASLAPPSAEQGVVPAHEELLQLAALRHAVGLAKGTPVIAALDRADDSVAFASRANVAEIATRGPLTPDHVIRTKPVAMVASGDWDTALAEYAERYRAYFGRHATPELTCLDPAPRWIIWPGAGFVAIGATVKDAAIVTDLSRHTARAIGWGERLGGWTPLPEADLFAVEYWELEQAKLRQGGAPPAMQGKAALVTGAASGIGRAVALALHAQGAAVLATDINEEVTALSRGGALVGWVADANDAAAMAGAIAECVRRFGGLDHVVSNAGVFAAGARIEQLDDARWAESLRLNLTSHMTLLRSAVPFLRHGFEPSVVIIGSKNVPAPGPGAAAYSVAKAGLAQLARVAALELGVDGIRINTVHPHLVVDTALWTPEVLAARAQSYGLTTEDYIRNNLLGVEITTRDVANAVLALLGPTFAKTTGAQIPIDGGSDRVV